MFTRLDQPRTWFDYLLHVTVYVVHIIYAEDRRGNEGDSEEYQRKGN